MKASHSTTLSKAASTKMPASHTPRQTCSTTSSNHTRTPSSTPSSTPPTNNVVGVAFGYEHTHSDDHETRVDMHTIIPTSPYQASIDDHPGRRQRFDDAVNPDHMSDHRDNESLDDILTNPFNNDYSRQAHQYINAARDPTNDSYSTQRVIPVSRSPYQAVLAQMQPAEHGFGYAASDD